MALNVGDRVALTANALRACVPFERQHDMADLRGEVIAIIGNGHLAVVQWDGFDPEDANHTYAAANLCPPKSKAFREASQGNSPYA